MSNSLGVRPPNPWWQRRAGFVVTIWLLACLLVTMLGFGLGMRTVLPGPSAKDSLLRFPGEKLAIEAGLQPLDPLVLVLSNPKLQVDAVEFIDARENLVELLQRQRGSTSAQLLYQSVNTVGHTWFKEVENIFISADRHNLLLRANSEVPLFDTAHEYANIKKVLSDWQQKNPNFRVSYLSEGTGDNELFELIDRDLDKSLIYTIPLTLLILLWAYGSVVAALVPLMMAVFSLSASLGVSAILSHLFGPVSATAAQLVVLLVMAVGVDYSLFMVSRLREEVARGSTYPKAIQIARSHSGMAVLWSGLTVAISLFGLLLMRDTVLTSMALVSIIAVLITVASSLLALPSLLILLGPNIEIGRLFRVENKAISKLSWVEKSVRSPILVVIFALGLLLLIAAPLRQIVLGSTVERELLPISMQTARAYRVLEQSFPEIAGTGFSLVLESEDLEDQEEAGALQPFLDELENLERVTRMDQMRHSADGKLARYDFIIKGSPNDPLNHKLLKLVREDLAPKYLGPLSVSAYFSGNLPFVVDETARYWANTPEVILVVLAFSALFLLLAFRSIPVPLKALCLNLLSTAAAFGVLVLLFQLGVVPAWNYGVIEGFVPALLFSILFGLSMDYHVFLISRIQENVRAGAATAEAVTKGIASTYRTITSAALIMAGVFGIIATLELSVMKQLGVGLAIAVLLDATVVRSLLLPATMVLLGRVNWYLPKCLEWLPKFKIG